MNRSELFGHDLGKPRRPVVKSCCRSGNSGRGNSDCSTGPRRARLGNGGAMGDASRVETAAAKAGRAASDRSRVGRLVRDALRKAY